MEHRLHTKFNKTKAIQQEIHKEIIFKLIKNHQQDPNLSNQIYIFFTEVRSAEVSSAKCFQ